MDISHYVRKLRPCPSTAMYPSVPAWLHLSSVLVASTSHGGCDGYPILASYTILFWVCCVSDAQGECNVYPVLALPFTLLLCPVTSWPSSMFQSPLLSCFSNPSSPVINPCQSATVFVFVFVLVYVSTVSPLSPILHHQIPVAIRHSGFMAPLGFSVFSSASISVIRFGFSVHPLFRHNLDFPRHHRLLLSRHSAHQIGLEPTLKGFLIVVGTWSTGG